MNPFQILFLLFLLIPILEIYVLIEVGSIIGPIPTVALVVLTAVVGAALIRAQGVRTLMKVQASIAAGQVPAIEMMEGAFILVAGALLLTPGFVTDAIGFACLIPPLRLAIIRGAIARQVRVHMAPGAGPFGEAPFGAAGGFNGGPASTGRPVGGPTGGGAPRRPGSPGGPPGGPPGGSAGGSAGPGARGPRRPGGPGSVIEGDYERKDPE